MSLELSATARLLQQNPEHLAGPAPQPFWVEIQRAADSRLAGHERPADPQAFLTAAECAKLQKILTAGRREAEKVREATALRCRSLVPLITHPCVRYGPDVWKWRFK